MSGPSFTQLDPFGDVQQLHRPIPEEVRPQHDSAVTKPLESLRPVMYSEPKKEGPDTVASRGQVPRSIHVCRQ